MVQKVEQLQVSKQITLADKPLHYVIKAVIFEGDLCYGKTGPKILFIFKCYNICFYDLCNKYPLLGKKRF